MRLSAAAYCVEITILLHTRIAIESESLKQTNIHPPVNLQVEIYLELDRQIQVDGNVETAVLLLFSSFGSFRFRGLFSPSPSLCKSA